MAEYQAKTRPTAVGVAEFISAIGDPVRRADAQRLDTMMRAVSGEGPRMWGPSIVGYGHYHYRYASGHECDAPRLGFSPRKAELVLYLLQNDAGDTGAEEALLARLGKHRRGKSCLYVRRLDAVDQDALEALIALSWNRMAERYPA